MAGRAGNPHEPGFGAGIDHTLADALGGLGNGLFQFAGPGRLRQGQGGHHGQSGQKKDDEYRFVPHEFLLPK